MKNGCKVIRLLAVAIAASFVFATSGFAATPFVCNPMTPTYVTPSGAWLVNASTGACGTLAKGDKRYFTFDTTNQDRILATMLTAFSLGSNVWVHSPDDVVNGAILDGVGIKK